MIKCYYKILGVPIEASYDEIKKSFRRLAMKWHPDHCAGKKEHFQEIMEAYETLIDPVKRAKYHLTRGYPSLNGNGTKRKTVVKDISPSKVKTNRSIIKERLQEYFDISWDPEITKLSGNLRFDIYLKADQVKDGWIEEISFVRLVYCRSCQAKLSKFRDCPVCYGRGFEEKAQTLTIRVPPDCHCEYTVHYPSLGDHLSPESIPGNLTVYIHVL